MFLRLGEGANPTETAGLCFTLLHTEPKTFQGFAAMAINRGETGLCYKQILRNWIAVRCCSVPAISSFQQSPSSCRLVAWPGQLFLLTVIPRYAPEAGSNNMGLEQPHLPKRKLIWGFCLYARLLLFYLRFSILAPVSYRESQSQARLWAR